MLEDFWVISISLAAYWLLFSVIWRLIKFVKIQIDNSMPHCTGCNAEVYGRHFQGVGLLWHPECFRCHACEQQISDPQFSESHNRPYHNNCYKELYHPRCGVCKHFIPINEAGLIEYKVHPFYKHKYCPSHAHDGTSTCCSCERMQALDARYLELDDDRNLCLECLDSAIMDTHDCQPLYREIQEFFKRLNLDVERHVPILLIDKQELNEAIKGEKNGLPYLRVTRGLCLFEEQTVSTILRRPRFGNFRITDTFTEPFRLIYRCEVKVILILYGLPRLMTGSILAHEMMHAWLRLNGYFYLSPKVEEGICQVLALLWLESEITGGGGSSVASSMSPSSPSKKGEWSQSEKKLGGFVKYQIESDTCAAYGDGFREGRKAVLKYGLKGTLDHIRLTGCFP